MKNRSRLNCIYRSMVSRCYESNNMNFKNYGARGITICNEWLDKGKINGNCTKGYFVFKNWALSHGYDDNLTIDRIDNSKGYSPENCRWVSRKIQQNNRRCNHVITYKGCTKTLKQWCEELNLNYRTTITRLDTYHWSVERAFETKENAKFHLVTYNGDTKPIKEWCEILGLKYNTVISRIVKRGWSVEKAFYKNMSSTTGTI